MSKVLRISQGGYKIITEPGSEILLNTGSAAGQVRITGDLIVEGARTELEVSVLEVEDKIILVNKANTQAAADYPGISPLGGPEAGMEIQRGSLSPVRIVYDESRSYFPPGETDLNQGIFVFKDTVNPPNLLGITTNYISSGGNDLHFNTGLQGKMQVKTSGPTPYSERLSEDDDIPNVKYIREYVRAEAGQAIIEKYSRFYTDEDDNFFDTRTGSRAQDVIAGDLSTGVFFTVALGTPGPNGSLGLNRNIYEVGSFNRKGLFVGDATPAGTTKPHLKLYVNEQSSPLDTNYSYVETDNGPLVLNPSDGLVKLKRKLEIEHLQVSAVDPEPVTNTNTIWSRGDQGAGGTGIYFVNPSTKGEICSAAKALVYGLIF
jgi:hypothetical protein